MVLHHAVIRWTLEGEGFPRGEFSRAHSWSFDGGLSVPASPSPAVVRAPYSDAAAVDPEEAFVASIASCHMLTFLHLASKAGFVVVSYVDEAHGVMTKNERRIPWVSLVSLFPRHEFSGARQPSDEEIEALHHAAHDECFIANSVKSEIVVKWSR